MSQESRESRSRVRRHRTWKCVSGLNAAAAVGLATVLVVMLNYLAFKYVELRWDISSRQYYALSDKTVSMLGGLSGRIRILAFVREDNVLYDDVRFLLREYDHAASRFPDLELEIEWIDPDRDLARASDLAKTYDVSEPNTVVFEAGERRKYVDTRSLVEYDRSIDYKKLLEGAPSVTRRRSGFRGEQVFSSAILGVAHMTTPTVYFLKGHGEHEVEDYGEQTGYSSVARLMRRDNIDVQPLILAEHGGIPEDADAIVVGGPNRRLSQAEVDILTDYLDRNGRLMILVDADTETGLERMLEKWGVKVGSDVVVGFTLTGRELFVMNYGDHPVVRRLQGMSTMFYRPRSVEQFSGTEGQDQGADRPKVTVLGLSTKEGWKEADLDQTPPKFDAGSDRIGPVGIAVAVEKGPLAGIEVEIKPTRMVVIGDSDFVSNGALRSGVGGNADFFMSAANWLLERESLLGVGPKTPGVLHLDMNRNQMRAAFLVIVFGVPFVAGFLGLVVWFRRRH